MQKSQVTQLIVPRWWQKSGDITEDDESDISDIYTQDDHDHVKSDETEQKLLPRVEKVLIEWSTQPELSENCWLLAGINNHDLILNTWSGKNDTSPGIDQFTLIDIDIILRLR